MQVHTGEILVHGPIAMARARRKADGWKAMWGIDGPVQQYESSPENVKATSHGATALLSRGHLRQLIAPVVV